MLRRVLSSSFRISSLLLSARSLRSSSARMRTDTAPTNKMAPEKRVLFAFDFDHTVIDENTDLYVVKMVPGGKIPADIKALYTKENWTKYMCEVFKYVHGLGIGPQEMIDFMCAMKFAPGMKALVEKLTDYKCDQIIISDSNSVFIDTILKRAGLADVFVDVFTNPAKFDDTGRLHVEFYHHQDWCSMSTVNMCKGHILSQFIEKQRCSNVEYANVIYVGDGSNDICPATRLRSSDYLFMRRGFRLHDLVLNPTEEKMKVKAKCTAYDDGAEILDSIRPILQAKSKNENGN